MKPCRLKFIAAGLLASAVASTTALAQTNKETRTIVINNGDTLINGKKLSELNRSEREKVQKDFQEMHNKLKESQVEIDGTGLIIQRNVNNGKEGNIIIRRSGKDLPQAFSWSSSDSLRTMRPGKDLKVYHFNHDSILIAMTDTAMVKRFKTETDLRMPMLHPRANAIEIPNSMHPPMPPRSYAEAVPGLLYRTGRNNSQSFIYSNTDKNGITTRMNIRLNDAGKDELKKITGKDSPNALTVEDLTLFPNFSTGKMTLSFNVSGKGAAEVKILDADTNPVFTDRAANLNGNYIKQVNLPKNGVYYIAIFQNEKWWVKKMIKE